MKPEKFDTDLRILASLVGTWDADELFVESYKELLLKIGAGSDPDVKYSQALRVRKLLISQLDFMANEWLRAKRESETKHDLCQ